MIGESGFNGSFMNDRFFNVHNGVSLSGFGYFPPVMFQALTTRVNVEKSPLTGEQLSVDNRRAFLHRLLYSLLVLLLLVVFLF